MKLLALSFQASASPVMEGIKGLHNYIMFSILVFSGLVIVYRVHFASISLLKAKLSESFFKDGRNLPLSLTIATGFLAWSLQQGFLSEMSLGFQGIWSLVYLYSMVQYRYTLSSLVNRLPLVLVLIVLKALLELVSLEQAYSWLLGLPALPELLTYLLQPVFAFLNERDYLALALLVMPGFSVEYTYWHNSPLQLGFGSRSVTLAGTLEEGVRKGELLKESLKTKKVCPDFQVFPQNMGNFVQQIISDTTYSIYSSSSRFGVPPQQLNKEDYLLPLEGENSFTFLRSKFAPVDTRSIEAFKSSFIGRYPGLGKGIGEEYLEKLPRVMVQQAYHQLATGAAVPPSSPLFKQLLQSDKELVGSHVLNSTTINPFLLLADQQSVVGTYLKNSPLELVGVFQTPLDCAVAVKDVSEGTVKKLGIEVKSHTLLSYTAAVLDLDKDEEKDEDTLKKLKNLQTVLESGQIDEGVLLVHNVFKPTLEDQQGFRSKFAESYGKKLKGKYRLVFL